MPLSTVDRRPLVAHVLHRLDVAGAEVLAAGLARQLAASPDHPYRFLFICLDGRGILGEQLAAEGFEVIQMDRRPGLDVALARRLGTLIRQRGVDLIHAHQYTPFFYAAVGRLPAARTPILFTEHGRHYPDHRRLRRVLANRFLLRRHDRVTAVGDFVKAALIANEGIAAHRIDVIHNGIDPAPFGEIDPAARQAARDGLCRELQLDAATLVVLQVARFHPVKDHATAIEAFARVAPDVPQAMLLLAGDGPEREAMERLAADRGVASRVRFLGLRRDVPRLMQAADLFLLSSLSEGVSLTLLEAMATPLPIVATDVGGNREVVAHGTTGLLSPRRDAAALAENLTALLRDPARRDRMAAAARERFLAHFTQARMHQDYENAYRAILTP